MTLEVERTLPNNPRCPGVRPLISIAIRNTSLPWSRKLRKRPPVLLLQAVRLAGTTLTLHLVWIVPPRLLTATPRKLDTPCPTPPTVRARLTDRTRRPIAMVLLRLRSLVSSWLASLGVKTRKKDIVLERLVIWKAPLLSENDTLEGVTKLPAESLAPGRLV